MKHIYMYMAPLYFTYLLFNYCFADSRFSIVRFATLSAVVSAVFAVSFGPFIYLHQLPQVLARMFPFARGLSNAYWAPNFWAVYNFVDKILSLALGMEQKVGNLTGGLVGHELQGTHCVIPEIKPYYTLVITLLSLVPLMWRVMDRAKDQTIFIPALTQCTLCFFLFSWHVHEKAIIMALIPLGFLVGRNSSYARVYFIMSCVGSYSLFPLLFLPTEICLRFFICLAYTLCSYIAFKIVHPGKFAIKPWEGLYLLGLLFVEAFSTIIHPLFLSHTGLTFLPLLLTSVYCSIGVLYCFGFCYKLLWSVKY
eukprot:TRINITY_DN22467_c0_g1_i1.p1 TRINITY_DN22467_c0_g1~~TRINITY_DN22467_c0_g1_i1.p1  ORF type:complete len:327 (+),score=1.02 TRINITY_DN22467_c0_g1_i1:57-983(+)